MLGPKESAWLSIHQIASDFVTSGVAPQYAFFDFNLPPRVRDQEFQEYWNSLHAEMKALGITVAGGHTGRYQGCDFTVIGGATLIGVGDEHEYLAPNMARVGDAIVVTKGAAIECTAILAKTFPKTISAKLGHSVLERAEKYLHQMSIVKEALVVMSKVGMAETRQGGGVTSMHDVEEGGVLSAICEVATASNNGFSISKSKIPLSEESREICELFGIWDPYVAIGGGSLVLTVSLNKAEKLVNALASERVRASIVGMMEPKKNGFKIADDRQYKVRYTVIDPYWGAFWKASRAGWN